MGGKRDLGWFYQIGVVFGLLALPSIAFAQAQGSIAGNVKDATGAVLPGVTVEASSPVLIEKVRSGVTDDQGNYKIVDLRPGPYTVTFTLPGFSNFKREGLELTTGFTATVNAELKVGSLEETVTVTGASPVVDVQNVRQQTVFKRDVQEALPVGRNFAMWATVIPGATLSNTSSQDVGGVQPASTYVGIHGLNPASMGLMQDGFTFRSSSAGIALRPNAASAEETTMQTSGVNADQSTGSVQMNQVPREGGNTFHGILVGAYGPKRFQSNNISSELKARGVGAYGDILRNRTMSGGVGGPIRPNKLWFYTTYGWVDSSKVQPGNYWNKTQSSYLYTPDLDRPAATEDTDKDYQARLTWQASQRNKVNFHLFVDNFCQCVFLQNAASSPEASARIQYTPVRMYQGTWSHPHTNRLLFDGGINYTRYSSNKAFQPGVSSDQVAVLELSRNYSYRAVANSLTSIGAYGRDNYDMVIQRFAVSYITGSHAFKVGVNAFQGTGEDASIINGDMKYQLRNGIPAAVQFWATPVTIRDKSKERGLYAQDQWTVKRWTLNLGVRYDTFVGSVPAQHLDAGPFVPARDFPAVKNVPHWKDIWPRLGMAYDVFGDGKTAIKLAFGEYAELEQIGSAVTISNPLNTMVTNATRTWVDANGDFIPQQTELGPLSNANFGRTVPGTRISDDVNLGWGKRRHNWQSAAQVQHQLWQGTAVNVGYFRTSFSNIAVTDNALVTPADYSPYCVASPADARLPGGGGKQVCGLFDLNPNKFGQVQNVIARGSEFGKNTQVFNGVDVTVNSQFAKGGIVSGGLATGSTVTDNCGPDGPRVDFGAQTGVSRAALVDSPQKQFCKVAPPWSAGTQLKFLVVYPLPVGFRVSATYQNIGGIPITANHVVTNAQVAPSLGRNLGQCGVAAVCNGTAVIELIEPGTMYENRLSQLDLRFTRIFRFGRSKLNGNVDIFNILNANTVLGITTRYGPSWLVPTAVLGGRVMKLGFQLDF